MVALSLAGNKYGRLTPIEVVGKDRWGSLLWRCRCDCGNEKNILGSMILRKRTQSCGCIKKEQRTTHGRWMTPEYVSWNKMIQRCHNPKNDGYNDYGARGIIVCKRWRESFEHFFDDMGTRPHGTTIDRIDNNGNYEKK